MNIFKLLFELFLLYLGYKLVFEFIIPVYKTTRQMREKMADLHQKMESQQRRHADPTPSTGTATKKQTTVAGDYIDYEEVK